MSPATVACGNLDTEVGRVVVEMGFATRTGNRILPRAAKAGFRSQSAQPGRSAGRKSASSPSTRPSASASSWKSGKARRSPAITCSGKLGKGAMATVYKAKQISLDRIVAVKVLPKKSSENIEFVERFYKEGKAAARLSHNNIVQAIDVGTHAGRISLFRDGIRRGQDALRHHAAAAGGRGAGVSPRPRRWTSSSRSPMRCITRISAA